MLRVGLNNMDLMSPPGDSDAHSSLRTTVLTVIVFQALISSTWGKLTICVWLSWLPGLIQYLRGNHLVIRDTHIYI